MVTRRAAGVLRPAALSTAAVEPGISPVPSSVRDALADPHWRRAMEEEYAALLANQTWDLVPPPPGGNVVTGKWIWTHKRRADGTLDRYKARWVLRGFTQRPGVDYDETFSPVVKPATVRTVLSLALSRSWPVHQLDVKNAFLHGTLTETVYCIQPAGFVDPTRPDMVCRLNKSLYGLKQAPRAWYSRFATFLVTLGFTEAKSDTSLFIYRHGDEMAYLLLYVDDIVLTASSPSLLQRIITSLQQEFAMKDLGVLHHFLGVTVEPRPSGLLLHQRQYTLDILERAGMADCNPCSTPVDTQAKLSEDAGPPVADPTAYRSLAGALQYLTFTRPDITYAVQQVCLHMHDPREPHLTALKRLLRYLRGTVDYGLFLHRSSSAELVVYTDDGGPGVRTLVGPRPATLSSWAATLSLGRPSGSRSSLAPAAEAEYRAVANGRGFRLRQLLAELHGPFAKSTLVYRDNVGAVYLSTNPVQHQRTKHVEIDLHFVRDRVAIGDVRVLHVPTTSQFADIFTKGLPSAVFSEFRSSLNIAREEKVTEIQRKRHSALDVSFKGRVRKVAKMVDVSDDDTDDYSPSESDHESTESDEEFHMCQICNTEEEKSLLLHCSGCSRHVHPSCLTPPWTGMMTDDWACYTCKIIEDEEKEQDANVADFSKRYDTAVEKRLKILDIIRSLDLPNNPLDDIIDQLGGPDNVAEITGRRGMLVRASDGKGVIYQARNAKEVSMEMINMHEKQQFMDGKKLIAIISEAGSAGVSLHADRRAKNQRRRVHITLELPWSADRAIQQFGRTHRSNQTSAPQYRLLFTNLGGEKRFASIVAKRLESLGALTQGDRRAGPSLSAFNYDSNYGKKALTMMYRGIMEQDSFPVVPPGCSDDETSIQEFINEAKSALVSVGIIRDAVICNGKDSGKLSGRIVDSDMHDVARFLNRLLGLPPNIQNRLFDLFTSILDIVLHNARIEGQLDSGIVDIKAKNVELKESPKTVHTDSLSGASTVLFTFTIDRGVTWESAKEMLDEKQKDGASSSYDGFYESRREWMGRRHFTLALEGSTEGMLKIIRPAIGEALREMPSSELKSKYRKVSSVDKVNKGWQEEYDASSKQVRQIHRRIRVVRLVTTNDSQRIVGLLIPNSAVESVLTGLQWVQDIDD
ncbi:LOW QUALITY PROTEIN: hypothetical protein U9M48_033752 [Paspalum notatum var. saurae]|uniref:PHD-type domain-containing protein n=1 Tax=Paspalum notatum var. saurae TaxID=547442 RepID=A0AAQ3X7E7_PASNO